MSFSPHSCSPSALQANAFTQALAIDILNPPPERQARTHKLKKIVPEPNSFLMDVKCPGCFQIT